MGINMQVIPWQEAFLYTRKKDIPNDKFKKKIEKSLKSPCSHTEIYFFILLILSFKTI